MTDYHAGPFRHTGCGARFSFKDGGEGAVSVSPEGVFILANFDPHFPVSATAVDRPLFKFEPGREWVPDLDLSRAFNPDRARERLLYAARLAGRLLPYADETRLIEPPLCIVLTTLQGRAEWEEWRRQHPRIRQYATKVAWYDSRLAKFGLAP